MGIFYTIFYQPIFNALIYLYNIIPGQDLGVAILVLTLIIKLILYPLSQQSIKAQKALQDINPEIEKIKEKYKEEKEKMGPELMALYKEKKVNPFSSCLPILIQLPVLFAIYRVFYDMFTRPEAMMNKQMLYFMPVFTIIIGAQFPAGLALYWLLTTLLSVAQQYLVLGRAK